MSTAEIIAAVVSTLLVAAGGVFLLVSKQREAHRDQELRSMLQPKGKLSLESARTARKKGLFGIGGGEAPTGDEEEIEDSDDLQA